MRAGLSRNAKAAFLRQPAIRDDFLSFQTGGYIMDTPILKMLKEFSKAKPLRLCTPGHKGRRPRRRDCRGPDRLRFDLDVTELSATDNLYRPVGAVKRALTLAAEAFKCGKVLFLTGGATGGIFFMLSAFKNKKIIISRRDSHKSVFNGCQLFNIEPLILDGIDPAEIENAFLQDGGLAALLVTSPNYYGGCKDLKALKEICFRYGRYLLVDGAHGSHFGFSRRLPDFVTGHADACVLSAHKTLPVLTQGAYLCLNGGGLAEKITGAYDAYNTSSPNFLILASLDYARAYLQKNAEKNFAAIYRAFEIFSKKLGGTPLRLVKADDFTRIVIDVSALNITGFRAQEFLNGIGVFCEFADFTSIVFILSVTDKPNILKKLLNALHKLADEVIEAGGKARLAAPAATADTAAGDENAAKAAAATANDTQAAAAKARAGKGTAHAAAATDAKTPPSNTFCKPRPIAAVDFLAAGNAEKTLCKIELAAGKTAAAEVGFYPPCTALLIRGELITKEICELLIGYSDRLFGVTEDKIYIIE
jgi:arginine/lysine/ornithine decarboxylase